MLYLFLVNTGEMIVLDLDNASLSVTQLKELIAVQCKISVNKQVLLISGGEPLEPNSRVCDYSAGTDTNPIFLFNKLMIESNMPPVNNIDAENTIDDEIRSQIEKNANLSLTLSSLIQKSQLANVIFERSKQLVEMCEKLVHYQHLQQQGWASVVVNLDDLAGDFTKRRHKFQLVVDEYSNLCESSIDSLNEFENNLELLKTVPLLSATVKSDIASDHSELQSDSLAHTVNGGAKNLYEWVMLQNDYESLKKAYNYCQSALAHFRVDFFESFINESDKIINATDNIEMKEIKGIEDRLYHLDKILSEVKKISNDQMDVFQVFVQKKNRATSSNSSDNSNTNISGFLKACDDQLKSLVNNYRKLRDFRRRCLSARDDFVTNIHQRLKWVMCSEIVISQSERDMLLYSESIQKVMKNLEVFRQIQSAPQLYISAVVETVRRRTFSQAFLMWATELACHISSVYNEEVAKRQKFQDEFEGHFVNVLFPGMEDTPSDYGIKPPKMFDISLPSLTNDDIDSLRKQLPQLMDQIEVPNFESLIKPFSILKFDDKLDDFKTLNEREIQISLMENMTQTSLIQSCESGNETEGFEEVVASPNNEIQTSVYNTDEILKTDKQNVTNRSVQSVEFIDDEHQNSAIENPDDDLNTMKMKLVEIGNENNELKLMNETLQMNVRDLTHDLDDLKKTISMNEDDMHSEVIGNQLKQLQNECNDKEQSIVQLTQRLNYLIKERNYLKDMYDSRYDEKYMRLSTSISSQFISSVASSNNCSQGNPIVNQPRPIFNKLFQMAHKKISLNCMIGDIVLVVWSSQHMSYMVVSDIEVFTFVHPDSYNSIGLGEYQLRSNSVPAKLFTFARVVDRESCLTKRSDNRYNIPMESQFYRIKVQRLDGQLEFLNKYSDDLSLNLLFPYIFESSTSYYTSISSISESPVLTEPSAI